MSTKARAKSGSPISTGRWAGGCRGDRRRDLRVHRAHAGVDLPVQLRERIEGAQAEFAGASAAQARLNQARLDADANAERQRGYLACNVCAQIDLVREQGEAQRKANEALHGSGVTVYAPGGGTGINVNAPG